MTLRSLWFVLVSGTIVFACAPQPANVPVAHGAKSASSAQCHAAGEWCAYNADCCSGRCEEEMEACH